MERVRYRAMPECSLGDEKVALPNPGPAPSVKIDSPAIEVMTDLRHVPAATIAPDVSLEQAHQAMIHHGVRLLLVCGQERQLVGVISASDLLGERPMQVAIERHSRREELRVEDVMTPLKDIVAVSVSDLLSAEVGHVIETLLRAGRQHVLVIEHDARKQAMVRGVISASQVARQLGLPVQPEAIARTFAEIQMALN